ncbi:VapC toxin family PIN domain ribonuclease [Roseateles sp.]|uniref:type II toxin-antitoxin system VapC family toxin n=1 Tax=Roseateles sp. TaxID=1971397 RepID=UPI00286CE850|nr:VapC toxin family PIN domain ribonuclease [Roseateles sp.]
MVLADTSVWIAHFRRPSLVLQSLAQTDQLLCHPLIVLELACGTPPAPRERTLGDLKLLQTCALASTDEIFTLIEAQGLYDSGCGAIDLALLAATLLTPNALLWTLDKSLDALALRLNVRFNPALH